MALQQITSGDINSTTGTGSTVVLSGTPTIATIDAGASTSLTLKSNSTNALILDTSQNLQFNSGYGSVATAYGCRAWVNFNGTGTVAIRASGNVTSITDNGVGNYTVNLTNAMPDANYSANVTAGGVGVGRQPITSASVDSSGNTVAPTTTAFRFNIVNTNVTQQDPDYCNVVIFR